MSINDQQRKNVEECLNKIETLVNSKQIDDETQVELSKICNSLLDKDRYQTKNTSYLVDTINMVISTISNENYDKQKNIEFIRQTRKNIEAATRFFPNPITVIKFWNNQPNPFYRLISGLIYFLLLILVIFPLGTIGWQKLSKKFVLDNSENISEENLEKTIMTLLDNDEQQTELYRFISNKLSKVNGLIIENQKETFTKACEEPILLSQEKCNKFSVDLPQTTTESSQTTAESSQTTTESSQTTAESSQTTSGPPDLSQINKNLENTNRILEDEKTFWESTYKTLLINVLDTNKTFIEEYKEIRKQETVLFANPQSQVIVSLRDTVNRSSKDEPLSYLFKNRFPDRYYFLWVLIAGGVGGVVSVLVKTKELITDAQDQEIDLFYVGFFRPLVGMSFGLLLFCIIESGAFSNFISIKAEPDDKKIYTYMAIAFVAGISDILTTNALKTTESTIKTIKK